MFYIFSSINIGNSSTISLVSHSLHSLLFQRFIILFIEKEYRNLCFFFGNVTDILINSVIRENKKRDVI